MWSQMTSPSVTQEHHLGVWQGAQLYVAANKANLVAVQVMDVTACSMGLCWGGLCHVVFIANGAWLQHGRLLLALLLSLGQSQQAGHPVGVKDGDRVQVTACHIPTSPQSPTHW